MADWKQITARIRRARGSRDPAAQLTLLFEKTKDAMVAFELGRHFEVVRDPAQALPWYQTAYSRFRRGEWKTKSSEAIVRLGGVPEDSASKSAEPSAAPSESVTAVTIADAALPLEQDGAADETVVSADTGEDSSSAGTSSTSASSAPASADGKRRRRGRRGGRNRNKKAPVAASSAPPSNIRAHRDSHAARTPEPELEIAPPRAVDSRSIPRVPVETVPESSAAGVRGRFGDPGLSSRLSLLEMQLRRLLTCPAVKLSEAEHAPAGPGVIVLTDDDMTTYYHVEACDTLRIAIASLSRSGATRRGNPDLKPLLADHLGIAESRAAKYLADHCVVRWLQLDEGAPQFAHFSIAVLRPILDE